MPHAVKILLPSFLILIALAAVGWTLYCRYFRTYHLATVQPGVLYRDGVRSIGEFEITAHKTGVKTVVSLVDDQEFNQPPFTDEEAYCKANNITIVRVPITLGGWPSGDQVQQFLAIATDPARQPVLVHCAQGVRRTGMMVAAYERTVMKYDKDQTVANLMTFGHSDRTVGDIKRFIDVYDPQTQRMTADLPMSDE
jgi:protein tyrosine/serine phosphatase